MCLLQYAAGLQTPQHTEDAWECHTESLGKNIITNVPVCCPLTHSNIHGLNRSSIVATPLATHHHAYLCLNVHTLD